MSAGLGQLLVWEWQSESYVLKQQGHFNSMVSLAYSPDGQYIVTGGDDGKVGTEWDQVILAGGAQPISPAPGEGSPLSGFEQRGLGSTCHPFCISRCPSPSAPSPTTTCSGPLTRVRTRWLCPPVPVPPQVKVWNTLSGFCFITFTEHSSGVTGVTFTATGYVIVTSSLDGTVRAFDLHR